MIYWLIGICAAFIGGYVLGAILAAGARSDEIKEKWMKEEMKPKTMNHEKPSLH